MALLKEVRSLSSGRLFQIIGVKNENEFVSCLTLLQKGISRVFTAFLWIRVHFRGVIRH